MGRLVLLKGGFSFWLTLSKAQYREKPSKQTLVEPRVAKRGRARCLSFNIVLFQTPIKQASVCESKGTYW